MLYHDIKVCFIEAEEMQNEDEQYLADLESCTKIEHLIQVVLDYHNLMDEFETTSFILLKVC